VSSTLCIDVGGTHLKAQVLDAEGRDVTSATRVDTPRPATPDAVVDALVDLAHEHRPFDRVSCGFPGVVTDGHTRSAPNLDGDWAGIPLAARLSGRLGVPVRIANDADVQGYGAVLGHGVELTITLGTGVGGGLFVDGTLVPNLEIGHAPFRDGQSFEDVLGMDGFRRLGVDAWQDALFEALAIWHALFNPTMLHLGGGHARRIDRPLPPNTRIVDNRAGLTGGVALWSR
jgi:polyphosphate glucokinase